MMVRAAVTSSNGKTVDLHFGRCSDFRIIELDSDSGEWTIMEERRVEQTCHDFVHQEEHVKEVVDLLSDCSFLLTYRIGMYPYLLFQRSGVICIETPTEIPISIPQAIRRLHQFLTVNGQPAPGGGFADAKAD